ncbi:MAG: aminodeoxychorismate synthase component I [Actinomycetota bacterium]|nr:aminodeoxychorismate synthase component I [Actinomycetota bacterium]
MTRTVGEPLPWVDPEDFFVAHAAERSRSFWLDGENARSWSGPRSYVGWLDDEEPSLTLDAHGGIVRLHDAWSTSDVGGDIFEVLRERVGAGDDAAHWVGYLGYAARRDLPALADPDPGAVPDACWLRAERWVEFDHVERTVRAVAAADAVASWQETVALLVAGTAVAPELPAPPQICATGRIGAGEYAAAFWTVQEHLRLGNSYETNLTFQTTVESTASALDTYRRLRRLNPAPYAAYLHHLGTSVLCSSPERFVTIDSDRRIETRPIKGTTARSPDPAADATAAELLRTDGKFRAENLMIVDLLRNDLSRVCDVGTVQVTDLMHVESYVTVHQLVSTIEGRLRADVLTVDAVRAIFPGGSMTGAPKERTMQIITEVESSPRGVYAGALGWIAADGSADLAIIIRTVVHHGGTYTFGTGGGLTVRSDLEEEHAEATWKATRLLQALGATSPGPPRAEGSGCDGVSWRPNRASPARSRDRR